ncbi:hypothetical protein RB653_008793 [Dictyostelium firmibasis]|uniref:Uncharacterized protein n=1 Tax=Dictyostelium firmibasis TaxID=79012 RepID=A0AAN7TT42_9MYCE
MIKAIFCFLFFFVALSSCFVPQTFQYNWDLNCPEFIGTTGCAVFNTNSYYYNEEQQSLFNTGTLSLHSPDPKVYLYDDVNGTKTQLSCFAIYYGGGNIRGPFFCLIPKNLTINEPIVINFLYPKDADLTSDGVYDSNVTVSFITQNITSTQVNLKNQTITINGDALLPRDGKATKENGMSIIVKFKNGTISDSLNCIVVVDFRKWVCKSNYPQYLSQEFQITYTYQYPTELKVTNITVPPTHEPSDSSVSSSNKFNSIASISLSLFFILLLVL